MRELHLLMLLSILSCPVASYATGCPTCTPPPTVTTFDPKHCLSGTISNSTLSTVNLTKAGEASSISGASSGVLNQYGQGANTLTLQSEGFATGSNTTTGQAGGNYHASANLSNTAQQTTTVKDIGTVKQNGAINGQFTVNGSNGTSQVQGVSRLESVGTLAVDPNSGLTQIGVSDVKLTNLSGSVTGGGLGSGNLSVTFTGKAY